MKIVAKWLYGLAEMLDPLAYVGIEKYDPTKPFLIWKIGSREQKWIPSKPHFEKVSSVLRRGGLDKAYNIIITHPFTEVEIIDSPSHRITIVNANEKIKELMGDSKVKK